MVRDLVHNTFSGKSTATGKPVPLDQTVLVRKIASKPFDPVTNAALMSMAELRAVDRAKNK